MKKRLTFALLVAGCGTAPTPPAPPLATPAPELIALRHFFASRKSGLLERIVTETRVMRPGLDRFS